MPTGRSATGSSRTNGNSKKSTKFTLEAPVAREVAIAGSFNDWTPKPMKRDAKGVWKISVSLPPGSHEYKFIVDAKWVEDPTGTQRVPAPFGGFNSVCVVPSTSAK
ncbi:MAG: hypothetical protein HZB43_12820 [candidate division Zixibacteria bacterium]|nr:hypothetical protein [candidate division Zixibacteria bacterium]